MALIQCDEISIDQTVVNLQIEEALWDKLREKVR